MPTWRCSLVSTGETRTRPAQSIALLEQTGIEAQADDAVGGYSAGMRQRLGLAAALIRSPQLLFLDEPTSALDPAGARDVRAIARRLADEGAAVVLSSHDMAEVEELCTMLTVMNAAAWCSPARSTSCGRWRPAAVHVLRTSDDGAALSVAAQRSAVKAAPMADGGLEVSAAVEALDAYIIALGRAGVAVRASGTPHALARIAVPRAHGARPTRIRRVPAPVDAERLHESAWRRERARHP